MNYLQHAIKLYKDEGQDESGQVKKLKIDYILAEDQREKTAIKITLLKMGVKIA